MTLNDISIEVLCQNAFYLVKILLGTIPSPIGEEFALLLGIVSIVKMYQMSLNFNVILSDVFLH